ncbi:MAG: hypothetical protein ACI9YE_003354 [Psychroserpens sp.]|jgi:hypothetical protein
MSRMSVYFLVLLFVSFSNHAALIVGVSSSGGQVSAFDLVTGQTSVLGFSLFFGASSIQIHDTSVVSEPSTFLLFSMFALFFMVKKLFEALI